VQKIAFTTPFGLFEFPFMSFDLRNAAHTFQRLMDELLRGLDFCYAYIDDILLYSHSPEEHEQHLRILFERLQTHGILLNPGKCLSSHSSQLSRLQDLRRRFTAAAGPGS
jgi:phosphoenolpyruvate carboxylase